MNKPEPGDKDPLDAKTFAYMIREVIEMHHRMHGRYPSQLEMDNVLVLSGLWEKGIRITMPDPGAKLGPS